MVSVNGECEAITVRLLSLLIAVTIAFFALRLLPGDAISADLVRSGASQAEIEARKTELGLNKPLLEQFGTYLAGLVRGDLGISLSRGLPVSEIIMAALPATVQLALAAFGVALAVGFMLGIGPPVITRIILSILLSMPIYWTGTLALFLFSAKLRLFPVSGMESIILPAGVLGLHSAGSIAKMIQTRIRETEHLDFVRTARSKGLSEWRVLSHHILRVGLIPVVSVVALQAGFLLSGTVIVETLFLRPGLGKLLLDAVMRRDYPVVQGVVLVSVVVYTVINIAADALYPVLDPRVRL
jgi:peptide/nickel transport system permease protein